MQPRDAASFEPRADHDGDPEDEEKEGDGEARDGLLALVRGFGLDEEIGGHLANGVGAGRGRGRITRHSVPFASIEPAEYALEVAFAGRAPAPARDHVKLAPWRR